MAKDTFYFSHDYNSRADEKIKLLIRRHGLLGYGIFWAIIEDLYNNANALRTDYEGIAFDLRVDVDVVKSVVNDFDLFIIKEDFFGSFSVQRRLEERKAKSKKASDSANYRWSKLKDDANALRTHCERNAIKERKGKEIKENTTTTRAHVCANAPSEVVVVEKWNKTKNLIHATKNKALVSDIQLLLKDFDIGTIEKAIEYCDNTPSLNGSSKSNFRAMLSWFVKKENFTRIVDSISASKIVTDEDRRAVAERKRLIVDDMNKLYSEKMNNIKVKIHKEFDFKEVDILNRTPLTAEEQKQEDEKYKLYNEKVEQTINEQNKRLNEKLAIMRSWLHNKMTNEQGENYNRDEYDFRELEEQRKIINCFGKL